MTEMREINLYYSISCSLLPLEKLPIAVIDRAGAHVSRGSSAMKKKGRAGVEGQQDQPRRFNVNKLENLKGGRRFRMV
jgi:hypothetical protein